MLILLLIKYDVIAQNSSTELYIKDESDEFGFIRCLLPLYICSVILLYNRPLQIRSYQFSGRIKYSLLCFVCICVRCVHVFVDVKFIKITVKLFLFLFSVGFYIDHIWALELTSVLS